MWRNLADFKKVQATLQTVAHAVAPPMESDDDSYDEEYDNDVRPEPSTGFSQPRVHSDLEEDEDIVSEEDDPAEYWAPSSEHHRPRGLVGLLTRALDEEQRAYDDSHRHDTDDDEEVDFDEGESEEMVGLAQPKSETRGSLFAPASMLDDEDEHRAQAAMRAARQALARPPPQASLEDRPEPRPPRRESGTVSPSKSSSESSLRVLAAARSEPMPVSSQPAPQQPKSLAALESSEDKDQSPAPPKPFPAANGGPPRRFLAPPHSPQPSSPLVPPQETRQQPPSATTPEPFPRLSTAVPRSPTLSPRTNGDRATTDHANLERLEKRCRELEQQLGLAQGRIIELQQERAAEESHDRTEELLQQFQAKEARLLQAASEEHELEVQRLRDQFEARTAALRADLDGERHAMQLERQALERRLKETSARAEQMEWQRQSQLSKQGDSVSKMQKEQERELRKTADQLASTMALLDEREEQVKKLKAMVHEMQSQVKEHKEGAKEVEEEADELHQENQELRRHAEALEERCVQLQSLVERLQADSDKLSGLKMELRLLKEEKERERAKNHSLTAAAQGSTAQLEEERDRALAEVQDLGQLLKATVADLGIARADTERIMMARDNLQAALESFQSEREAEYAIWEEQRLEKEQAIAAAHAAALEATHEAHQAQIREIQSAADAAVRNAMEEIRQLETKQKELLSENVQMRRSLDEAIHRLQTTQEDVIDRTLMKNILMDWLTKTHAKERRDVLELMASVLHFTEEEKEKVHIGSPAGGALGKVVHSVAAPLPPSKADVERLQGENVREKWVNFLLAETDD